MDLDIWGTLGMVARPWSSSRLSCGERLLLRCDGNAGNSFRTTQGKYPSSLARRRKRVSSGKIPLPIWIVREEYRAFDFEEITLSEIEAKAAALSEAWLQLSKGELIWAQESYSFEGGVAKVTLRYRMIEDVAENLPLFEVK